MRLQSLVTFALLSACVPTGDAPDDKDTVPDDTDTDTVPDDTDTPTGDTDTGDTGTTPPSAHAWAASFDAPDLVVRSCGTDDNGHQPVAPGPDLDGDGLAELAIGTPGHDGHWGNSGGVYVFAGSDLVDGARTWDAATLVTPLAEESDSFGDRVEWVGDRDGDGLDDLLVSGHFGGLWTVSGAVLLGGGEVAPHAMLASGVVNVARWADVDGDGRDDWLFAYTQEGPDGEDDGYGAVALVLDGDFTLDGAIRTTTAYGKEIRAAAGTALAALHGDQDGDGIPEFALSMYDEVHIIGSAAFLAGEDQLLAAARTTVPYMWGHDILAPGDTNGDGLDELLVFRAYDKLCVVDGADTDGSEKVCIRDGGLGPTLGAVLGDDLDNDGVPDVWLTRDGYLVAIDVGALAQGIELELARVAPPTTMYGLGFGDGRVWGGTYVDTNGGEADVAHAFTASLSPRREVTLRGGQWGGTPSAPVWRDVTGDGTVDLVLPNASGRDDVAAFDGTTLPAGGDVSWCDATWSREWGTDVVIEWIDDVDGDGADDALVLTEQEDETWRNEVWPGPVAIGLAEGEPLATWTDDTYVYALDGCDVDGDGRQDLVTRADGWWGVYSGTLESGGRFTGLGALQLTTSLGCLPDVDGDGGDELYTTYGNTWWVYRSSQLEPGRILSQDEAWLSVPTSELRRLVALQAPDGGEGLTAAWVQIGGDYQLCALDLAGLSGEVVAADVPMTCAPDIYNTPYADGWLAAAVGDDAPDILLYGEPIGEDTALRVVDGALFGASEVLVSVGDVAPSQVGPGSDVLGVGASAIWARQEEPDRLGRYQLDILYARAVE